MRMAKKTLAFLLVFCMVAALLPTTVLVAEASAAGSIGKGDSIEGTDLYVTSVKNYSIAPDITEKVIVTNNSAGISQTVANVMEVNVSNGKAKLVTGYGNLNPSVEGWTLMTMTGQAHLYEQATNENVVGGVNASWFNIETGEPSGNLVMRGVVHKSNTSRTFIAVFSDGSVNLFKAGTSLSAALAEQKKLRNDNSLTIVEAVDGSDGILVWDGVPYTSGGNDGPYSRTAIGIKADGTIVLFQSDGTMPPRSLGYDVYEEANMMAALGCVKAIRLDEGGSSTFISQREGEADLAMRNIPAGGSERKIAGSVLVVSTVKPTGEFDHAKITPDAEYFTPNSTIELTATALDYSGREANAMPSDARFVLANDGMGTIGQTTVSGKKATATFSSNGNTGDVIVNLVSENEVVGTATVRIQNPDSLKFTSSEINLNYKQVSDLGLRATYLTETVNLKDGDVVWEITDESAGSFNGNLFTVTSNVKYSGSPVVTARIGELTASITVNIGMQPTMILDGGDEDIWDYSMIGTTVEDFEGMPSNAVATYHYAGRGGKVVGSVISDTQEEWADIVRFGHNAIKLDFDWTELTGTDGACLGLGDNMPIDGTPTAIGVWVYIPEGVPVPWLRAQVATSTDGGATWTDAFINFTTESGEGVVNGWQYLEADLRSYSASLIRVNQGMLFRAMVTMAGIGWKTADGVVLSKNQLVGYIILDNLCIIYGANNQDVTSPAVTSIATINEDGSRTELENGAVFDKNHLNFYVTYNDFELSDPFATGVESAYFYFDGTYFGPCEKDNLGSWTTGLIFPNGQHSITFYLKDGYGNVTRETRYFTVAATEETDENYDMTNVRLIADEKPEVGKNWKLHLVTNRSTDISSVEAILSITRGYSVSNVLFAEGITNGTYTYDANKGTLNVQIPFIGDNQIDTETLATIVVGIPENVIEGTTVSAQVTKGIFGSYQYSNENGYITQFSTPRISYPIAATYRIIADTIVKDHPSFATVTVIDEASGKTAEGVSVYANGMFVGKTDSNGEVDISGLNTEIGSYTLNAKDDDGNCSYQITVSCFAPIGNEDGTPYNILFNMVDNASCEKNITWMSNPDYSDAVALIKYSTSEDLADPVLVEGSSRLVSYSVSKVINRVNQVYLTNLAADTTYYFVVGDGNSWSEVRSFTTPAAKDETTRIFILGDIQGDAADLGMSLVADHILNGPFDFGIQLGDAIDNVRQYDRWEEVLDLFNIDRLNTNILHVIGNHEADDDGNNSYAAKSVFGIKDDWYSFEYGAVYVAVLNHTLVPDELQAFGRWLVEDASGSRCPWKLLMLHVPVYYTNPTGGGEVILANLREYIDAAGIDFCFSANDHSYARTAPMTNGVIDETNGTVYYVAGNIGGKSYPVVNNPSFNFQIATIAFDHVYLDLTADKFNISITAYNVNNNGNAAVLDTYSRAVIICEEGYHTYEYDRVTDELFCTTCGHETTAAADFYNDWATDRATGKLMYFEAGKYVVGSTKIGTVPVYFDEIGLALDGQYNICGETVTFKDGFYIGCDNPNVVVAGFSGVTVEWIIYNDGTFKTGGYGPMQDYAREGVAPWSDYKTLLKTIIIGADITEVGSLSKSFYVTSIVFEEGSKLEKIQDGCFTYLSSLKSVTLPESLVTLGYYGFKQCNNLTYVYIPQGTKNIHMTAFDESPNVVLDVAEDSYGYDYAIARGIPYTTRPFIDSVVDSGICGDDITWTLFASRKLVLSGSGAMHDFGSQHEQPWAANRLNIRSVEVDANITSIGAYAFFEAKNLRFVTFAEGSKLGSLNRMAFCWCSSLTRIDLPERVKTIGDRALAYSSALVDVYVPQSVNNIGSLSFTGSGKVKLYVAEGSYAHEYALSKGIAYVTRPFDDFVVDSGICGADITWTLYSSGRLELNGSGPMYDFGSQNAQPWAADRLSIRSVEVDADITTIGAYAFYEAKNLKDVTFAAGSKLESLNRMAFCWCSGLTRIDLPESVKTIVDRALAYSSAIVDVYVPQGVNNIGSLSFAGSNNVKLYVAEGSYAHEYALSKGIAYVTRPFDNFVVDSGICGDDITWTLYANGRFVLSGSGAMYDFVNQNTQPWAANRLSIRSIEVDADITTIGAYAFYEAKNLKDVTFEAGSRLESLNKMAFCWCSSLTGIDLPEGVKKIIDRSLAYCGALVDVYVPQGVDTIGSLSFAGSNNVMLYVAEGSYAHEYAISKGIAYTTY